MVSMYPACFYEEDNGYSVFFPDLEVATCGCSLEEALKMAVDVLAGILKFMADQGEEWPMPSDLSKLEPEAYEGFEGECFATLVPVDVDEYAKMNFGDTARRTVNIPLWLDDIVIDKEIDLSEVLQDALKTQLNL